VDVAADVREARGGRQPQQKIGEVVARKFSFKSECAVVVAAHKAQRGFEAQAAEVGPEFRRVPALDPGEVVIELKIAGLAEAGLSLAEVGSRSRKIDLR